MQDGHGIAHPIRMRIATHFGVLQNIPAIGCGKRIETPNLTNCWVKFFLR